MKVVDVNNTSIYLHKHSNASYATGIPITDKEFVVVSFNDSSTIYDEQPNPSRSPLSPYCHCIWSINTFGKYGMGIGE